MKLNYKLFLSIVSVCLLGASCTERRTMSDPVPDGDTVEVVINGDDKAPQPGMPQYIDVPDSVDLSRP